LAVRSFHNVVPTPSKIVTICVEDVSSKILLGSIARSSFDQALGRRVIPK
jgi:hypothetical protein